MRDLRGIADCLGAMALLEAGRGEHVTATTLLGAAAAQREAAAQELLPWQERFIQQAMNQCRSKLGSVAFDEALAQGRRLARDEAIDLALGHGVSTASSLRPATA